MKRICVYCGSNVGTRDEYAVGARALADGLVERNIHLVYGGGNVGLMGVIADRVLERGGEVDGVIPRHLFGKELGHQGVTRLHVVESMHERKAKMADLSDAFVAMPGGLGTLEELAEIATWTQLGLQQKPLGLLDVAGFYAPLVAFFDHAVQEGFLREEHRRMIVVDADPRALLAALEAWRPIAVEKWLDRATR